MWEELAQWGVTPLVTVEEADELSRFLASGRIASLRSTSCPVSCSRCLSSTRHFNETIEFDRPFEGGMMEDIPSYQQVLDGKGDPASSPPV